MATTHGEVVLESIETKLSELLNTPEIFYKPQFENTVNIKQLSQKSYHAAVSDELFKGKSLSKLLIDGFDEEQIWQQSDLLNKAASVKISDFIHMFDEKYLSSVFSVNLSTSSINKEKSKSLANQENKSTDKNTASFSSQESSAEEDYAFDDDSDSATEFDTKLKKAHRKREKTECASDIDSDSDSSTDFKKKLKKVELPQKKSEYASNVDEDSHSSTEFHKKTERKQSPLKKSGYASVVDDQFFKLHELDNFLRIEDLKEERGGDSVSDDDKIDLFQDIPSDGLDNTDDESEEEQGKIKKSAREFKYEDFYKDCASESESENKNAFNGQNESLMEENEEYAYDESESNDEMETGEKDDEQKANSMCNEENKKTKFELEQEKTKKIIQECEKSMLEPLSWQLTGEVAADKRPVNSLLEVEADFDCNTKQDVLVDRDLNQKVEEITIMAIRNKAFFDVERKFKPTEDIITYKKEAALEQTKSKKSLAEVYAEDYLKKKYKQDAEEEENPKHKEIKKLMDSLLPQLHALFSHIPKPAIPEIKIVSNLPAITVEEVAPTNVSDATLLAPEEVKKKTGLVKSKTERTDTDRKRERRKKKIHQRLKEKKKLEKLESQKGNPSAKVSKLEKIQALKKLKQHKNTKIASVDEGGKIKSSKDFFSRLQDTMDTKNKTKISGKKMKSK